MEEFFNGKKPNSSINPNEAIARGAALQAANRNVDLHLRMGIVDVTPLSVGVKKSEGRMSVRIERNSHIPISRTRSFGTCGHNQSRMAFAVYEGERARFADNRHIDVFKVDIPPTRRGQEAVDVTFIIDTN